jgi:GTPase SAR1 family protein
MGNGNSTQAQLFLLYSAINTSPRGDKLMATHPIKAAEVLSLAELIQQARTLSNERRKEILMSFRELELQRHLKELFKSMEPTYTVEVTQGASEHGKDLVLVKQDKLTVDVIGVVVKCGNIKAKTLGEVEEVNDRVNRALTYNSEMKTREVESQIKQAFAHEAELKDFFETLPVNKVIAIIAGDISREARVRLEKEMDGPVEVHGIDWLITNFTDFYPQVFFEGALTDFLQRKVQELETKHRVIRSNKILSECFVDPIVRATDVNRDFGEELRAIISRKDLPFSRLKALFSTRKKIILVGDPGTGKSAALAKFTIDLLKEIYMKAAKSGGKQEKPSIPVLVTARSLLTIKTEKELLDEYLGESEIRHRITIKVLLVDGLDEVSSVKRSEVIEKAKTFAEKLESSLLVASRKVDLLSVTPAGFEKYELLPFGAGQALQLIEKIQTNNDVIATLREGLEKIRYQIPMVPLSLILLMEIVEEQKEVPASVTELYDRYIDSVLGRWDKEKGIEVLFEYLIKKRFLAELAFFEFGSKKLVEITREDFDSFCVRYAHEYGLEEQVEKFVQEIKRAGVLEVSEETVLFGHRSFLDYFSAFYIYTGSDEFDDLNGFVVDMYYDDAWGETAFFYVGQKRKISEKLLERILIREGNSIWINSQKFMVGRLLQAGWYSPTAVKSKGLERAVGYIPTIRESLYRVAERGKWPEPKIMVDVLLLGAANYSFRSTFLARELQDLFNTEIVKDEHPDLSSLIYLLSVMKPFISPNEFNNSMEKLLAVVSSDKIEGGEKLRATLLLLVIKGSDKTLSKAIKTRVQRLREQFPKEFKNLLPPLPTHKEKWNPPIKRK